MSVRVWCLGDAVVDLLPEMPGRLMQCPGGAPANVAVGVARLQGNSAFIGRVGDDPFGEFMRQTLIEEKVETRYMIADTQHRTSTVVVGLDDHGERSFTFMVRPSADLFLEVQDLPVFRHGEWLHCCSIALSAEPSRTATLTAMEQIRAAGGHVSFDLNLRHDLWPDPELLHAVVNEALSHADVVKLSDEELDFLCPDQEPAITMPQLAVRFSIKLLLVTRGREGVIACYQGQLYHYATSPVASIDTTGAGDAFVAGLLWGLAKSCLPADESQLAICLTSAQRCGALATTAKGAMTALPRLHQLDDLPG